MPASRFTESLPIVCPHCREVTRVPIAKLVKDKGSTCCRSCGKATKATEQFLRAIATLGSFRVERGPPVR